MREQIEQRHPDGNTVGHLVQDNRIGAVCDFRADFYPRFIGPGCIIKTSFLASLSLSPFMPYKVAYSRSEGNNICCCLSF